MKVQVVCVGKLKERFWVEAQSEYLKRLSGYAKVEVAEVADRDPARFGGEDAAREREGEELLARIEAKAHVVLLAIEGKERSSEDFAARLDALKLAGTSAVAFVVGGSTGASRAVYDRADETLSFGRITLPHNLARIVLLEQVYRAFRISRGEPYHK